MSKESKPRSKDDFFNLLDGIQESLLSLNKSMAKRGEPDTERFDTLATRLEDFLDSANPPKGKKVKATNKRGRETDDVEDSDEEDEGGSFLDGIFD